ncbi:MAG: hypothetical protein ACI3ZN_03285 [Candidatus Cryptobacteroides sp.]
MKTKIDYADTVLFLGFDEPVLGLVARLGFGALVSVSEADADDHFVAFAETELLPDFLDRLARRVVR